MAGLNGPTGGAQPPMAWGTPRIQMSAHQTELAATESDGRRDRHSALQYQRQLGGMRFLQREAGEDGVSPVALEGTISHRGGVSKIETKGLGGLDHILLSLELRHQHPPGATG